MKWKKFQQCIVCTQYIRFKREAIYTNKESVIRDGIFYNLDKQILSGGVLLYSPLDLHPANFSHPT